ncbi:sigma-70 family RNA polymerase sigma factor [Adhaeribacter swui]|uniref:Sigma-70 family RNA polymerase sigma factor n=1 Tax=Adhaeribacter swui TaxID=2086471 RepID=A0A7G7GER4_9BACT|nr:sigma-70 family RNA polymerase sigma factor [Adhaeribacter swui]QNF35648.1 sigma-70 family RNA polymerase sigma factor [Adhaeribacter swui]
MKHPDQKYIEALVSNNEILVEEIYRRFSGKIKWMVIKNNGTEAEAGDIFQEALLAISHRAKTQGLILSCPFDAFIYSICKNLWLKVLNKKKSHSSVTDPEEMEIGEDSLQLAEECLIQEQRLQLLNEKLDELGGKCAELLRLNWSGKSMEEVAEDLQISYAFARKKKVGCMDKLINLIKRDPQFNTLKW